MWPVKDGYYVVQVQTDAAAFPLHRATTRPDYQTLDIRPPDVGPCRPVEYRNQGLAVLVVHHKLDIAF
jgi:hypothetical protein